MTLYSSPTALTVKRLKNFCIAGSGLSATAAPILLLAESPLPMFARVGLAATGVLGTSVTAALVAVYFRPYVHTIRRNDAGALEFTTATFFSSPRITTVFDSAFLQESRRPGAKLELAESIDHPKTGDGAPAPATEETVAQTTDARGKVLGRWIVTWREGGAGSCRAVGNIVRFFSYHDELLEQPLK